MSTSPSSGFRGLGAGIRWRFFAWSGFVAALLIVFLFRVLPALKIETDILALLPSAQQDSAVDDALDDFAARLARKQLFLIGAPTPDVAKSAAAAFAEKLAASDAFSRIDFEIDADLQQSLAVYLQHRGFLLSSSDLDALQSGRTSALERRALRAAFTPASFVQPVGLADDPMGLLNAFLEQQKPFLGNARLDGTVLSITSADFTYVMVAAECAESPFASSLQERAMPAIERAKQAATAVATDVRILSSGALQHAAAATERATSEIATFGTLETIAVILLLWTILGALRPLLLASITLGIAALTALTVVHYLFGTVHILALVFGSSLIGGVIDYSIHFFADRFRDPKNWTPPAAVSHVGGAILLGLTTTLIGYVVLMLVPFPGLKQIAAFCAAGLAAGCGCVLCWYPVFAKAGRRLPTAGPRAGAAIDRFFAEWRWTRLRVAIGGLSLALALIGLQRVIIQDDIRALQSSPPELVAQEQAVRDLLGSGVETRFFLVTGESEQSVMNAERRLTRALDGLIDRKSLTSYQAITASVPSIEQQQAMHRAQAEHVYSRGGLLDRVLPTLGFPADAIERRRREFESAGEPITLEEWLKTPAAEAQRHLWLGKAGTNYAAVVALGGIRDVGSLREIDLPQVRLIDRVTATTEILGRYRSVMSWLLAGIYVVAGLVLTVRFGWRIAPRLLVPSALATAVTLGLFGWFGVPVNLFTLLALWLVLGLGIDYGIFIRHGQASKDEASRPTAILSVTLSACTTLLAFGTLSFSATPFIRSIGLTLLCAIMLSWVFVLFSCLTNANSSRQVESPS